MKRSFAALLMVVVAACSGAASSTDAAQGPTASQALADSRPGHRGAINVASSDHDRLERTHRHRESGATRRGVSSIPRGPYRITVPDSWEARHGAIAEGIEVWLAGEIEDGFGPNVNVLTQTTGNMTLDEYTESSIANAPNFVKDFEVLDSRRETGPNGTELGRPGVVRRSRDRPAAPVPCRLDRQRRAGRRRDVHDDARTL